MWNCLQEEETRCKKTDDDEKKPKKPKDKAKVSALFICLGGDAMQASMVMGSTIESSHGKFEIIDLSQFEKLLWY